MRRLTPSQIRFREFMRKLTGRPGLMNWLFYAYSWQVHGVLITLEKGSTTVRVYHDHQGSAKDCTAGGTAASRATGSCCCLNTLQLFDIARFLVPSSLVPFPDHGITRSLQGRPGVRFLP